MREIQLPVEAAHVLMFARAVGDPNPVYSDAAYAAAQGLTAVIAPPTFPIAADVFDPDYERRPRPGVPWFGSGRNPVSTAGGPQLIRGGPSGFHAEEHFVYHRYPKVGDRLWGRARDGETWHKQGRRGGRLGFRERITEYRDASGEPVVTARWVDVLTKRHVAVDADADPPAAAQRPEGAGPAARASRESLEQGGGAIVLRGRRIVPGQAHEQIVVEDLKRTQIVGYRENNLRSGSTSAYGRSVKPDGEPRDGARPRRRPSRLALSQSRHRGWQRPRWRQSRARSPTRFHWRTTSTSW